MSKRDKAGQQRPDPEQMNVTVVGNTIPVEAHFEVVSSLDAKQPWKLRFRLAGDPPADLAPELKARWPKPEDWAGGPEKAQMDLLCVLANKALVRGIETGSQAMAAHIMRSIGFMAELEFAPQIEELAKLQASAKVVLP